MEILAKRREEEISEFEKLLKIKTLNKEKTKWYCLEMEWYLQWKAFVTNDITEKTKNIIRQSENKEIGN